MDKKSRSDLRKRNRKNNRPIYCLVLCDGRIAYRYNDQELDSETREYVRQKIEESGLVEGHFFVRDTLAKTVRLLDRFDPHRKGAILIIKPNRKERLIATAIFANETFIR